MDIALTPRSMLVDLDDRAARGEVEILDASGACHRVIGWRRFSGRGFESAVAFMSRSVLTEPIVESTTLLGLEAFKRELARALASRFAYDEGPEAVEALDLINCVHEATSYVDVLLTIKSRLQ